MNPTPFSMIETFLHIFQFQTLWNWKSNHRNLVVVYYRTLFGRCHKTILSSYVPAADHHYTGALDHRPVYSHLSTFL